MYFVTMTSSPTIDAHRRKFSVAEYHRLLETGILTEEDRVELIYGEIIEMSLIGPKHAANLDRIAKFLTLLILDAGIVRVQSPIQLGDHSEPEPDIALLQPREDFYLNRHPRENEVRLILELSDSSLKYDKEAKLPLYASFKIPEVWLVDLKHDRIIVHCKPDGERYSKVNNFQKGETIQSELLPKLVSVNEILL